MATNKDETKYDAGCDISIADDVDFNYIIKIGKFKKAVDNYPVDKFLQCDPFIIPLKDRNIPVEVRVYPNGYKNPTTGVSYEDYVMVGTINKHKESVMLDIECAIIDRDGKKQQVQNYKFNPKEWKKDICKVFNLVKRDLLLREGSSLLDADGNLSFSIKFTIEQSDTVNRSFTARDDAVEDDATHTDDMKNMLKNAEEYFSDMEIECLDGNIPCHSNILASKSEVFKAMFSHDMQETRTKKVEMKDEQGALLSKEIVLNILLFIYTGKIDTEKISLEILKLADKYKLQHLKNQCVKHLCKYIDINNCVDTIVLADRILNTGSLKIAAKQFILNNLTTELQEEIKGKCDKDLMMELLVEKIDNFKCGPPPKRPRNQSDN